MADPIRFNVYVTVKEGRLEEFKKIARDWSAHHKKERIDVLSYEWFISPDGTRCQVMELYESSEAMLATMEQVSESDVSEKPDYPYEMDKLEVCGDISNALRVKLDAGESPIEYWGFIDGVRR